MITIDERPASTPTHRHDTQELRELVTDLAVPRHRLVNAQGNAVTRERLCDALTDAGLQVQVSGRYGNVVALPRRPKAPLLLVAAHYDAVPDCPGADDNASGLAVLISCARAVHGSDLGFIAFNAEEDGMLGSHDFVRNDLSSLGELEVVHVLETVGVSAGCVQHSPLPLLGKAFRRPDFLGLLGKGASNSVVRRIIGSNAAPGLRVLGARTFGPIDRVLPNLRRSDHVPFWDAGLPAVMWTDTADFRNPHYHQPSDTAATLDYDFMAQVRNLLVAEAGTSPLSQTLPR